jgi:cytochrome c-type biogenesis protein CcmH/NrfF
MCGTCERLPLTSCACDWADDMRKRLASRLSIGESEASITDWYSKTYGTSALNVPPSRGFLRSLWIVPTLFVLVGASGAVLLVRSWRKRPDDGAKGGDEPSAKKKGAAPQGKDDYDHKLDEELRDDE